MQFNKDKPIYLQLADRLSDDIVDGKYNDDDRVPSVREFGMCFEVNTNTAMKAYDMLSRDNVIYNRRGLGYFVTQGAREKIMESRRNEFMTSVLPDVFRQMRMLGIGIEEFTKKWSESSK
ncbi:GntR family transcriptional regulator [Prevotella sp.]|uniref:GntR family transcriptional regulator n=1 Tax=Prevotella sp. TaxID=59823 RepID=UPI0027E388CF|nr:GntR family transcriptional regulator [Prevotella sp.]